jgi:hypothetical protein
MSPEIAIISMGPSNVQQSWSAWQHGHPRRDLVALVDGSVNRPRASQKIVKVADGQRSFSNYTMRDAVYATGWDGDVVVTANAAGDLQVSTSR